MTHQMAVAAAGVRVPAVFLLTLALLTATPAGAQETGRAPHPEAAAPEVPVAVPAVARSWRSVFGNLGRDLRRLPSHETFTLLGLGGVVAAVGYQYDGALAARAAGSQTLDNMVEPGEALGGGEAQFAGAAAAYMYGRLTGRPRVATAGADLFRAQVLNAALTTAVKVAVRRRRPDDGRHSFPSGHTSGAFASAAVLSRHFGWKVGLPAYGVATMVAGSRMEQNRHFISDVIFGAAIGIAAGRTVTLGRGRATFAVAPVAMPGGGGVTLTLADRD